MFSLLTRTFVRITSPIVFPLIRPAIAHAVGYFQPIEAEFDSDFYPNERVATAVGKVRRNVAIAKKQLKAVAEAPKAVAEAPKAITSLVYGKSVVLITSIVKAPVVVASRVIGMSTDPMSTAGKIVESVKRFVPSFLSSTIRTYRGTPTKITDPEANPKEPQAKSCRSVDDDAVLASASCPSPARDTISVYPSPPPSLADPFSPPRGSPPFLSASQPVTPGNGTTSTTANLASAPPLVSLRATFINGSPRSDTISELVLGSPISSLNLVDSLDSIVNQPNGFFTGGNENSIDVITDISRREGSSSSSIDLDSSSVEVPPANSPVNNDGLIAAPSDISLPSPTCSSDLSEIPLPAYSPAGPHNDHDHNNSNLSATESFSENEEDAVSRARAIAFRPNHGESANLDSSLGQSPG